MAKDALTFKDVRLMANNKKPINNSSSSNNKNNNNINNNNNTSLRIPRSDAGVRFPPPLLWRLAGKPRRG